MIGPPRDVPAAIWRLAIGLSLIFLLGPNVRFGYFLHPFGLLGWLALTQETKVAPLRRVVDPVQDAPHRVPPQKFRQAGTRKCEI
jgi:hypothetical protein